jgi:AMMECR1 domain-containing protein/orotate phosphoribosyltransferase
MDNPIPQDPALARAELCALLREQAILRAGPGQPIRHVDGEEAPWMFYSWRVTLTERGAALAAACILDRLQSYRATQIASIGYTAIPLVAACVLRGGGRYRGLCVREERKPYGSLRRVEGPADPSRPVVLVDDSIVSGTSLARGIEALESEGLEVEGAIGLVSFAAGGEERLRSLGYSVECLFDLYRDLQMPPPPRFFQFRSVLPSAWEEPAIEDGLPPAVAARRVAERYLASGKLPHPPRRFDRDYDGRGGVFVSFRERDTERRITRHGFWHFDAGEAELTRDLVLATGMALDERPPELTLDALGGLKLGVTFCGPLEKIAPAGLDFARCGIVVLSRLGERAGGALPSTQCFLGEVEQYHQARVVNAELLEGEPHDLYRHTVTKSVEPGEYWLPFGAPPEEDWTTRDEVGRALTLRARQHLLALERGVPALGAPLPEDLIPAPVFTVAVTLYANGVLGCGLAWEGTLDDCVRQAAEVALQDDRFDEERRGRRVSEMSVAVSILHDQEWLGEASAEEAAFKVRRGLHSLSVEHENGGAIFLPVVCAYQNWTKEEMAEELLHKAEDPPPPWEWAIYPTATWLRRGDDAARLRFGFLDRAEESYPPSAWRRDIALLGAYIHRHIAADRLPEYAYYPVSGETVIEGLPARRIHALWALAEAGRVLGESEWRHAAAMGLRHCLGLLRPFDGGATFSFPGEESSAMADALLLAALSSCDGGVLIGAGTEGLARRVQSLLLETGRIAEHAMALGVPADHDYLPGAVLLALALYAQASGDRRPLARVADCLRWYRRRFRLFPTWGMAGWHPQAWAALHETSGDREHADLALEIADWALPRQHEKTGSFLCDLEPAGFTFHTGFLCEGMAAAWKVARSLGDAERTERSRRSCEEGLRFMNRLILREDDAFCLAEPSAAVGGVRAALYLSEVRIDYVSHTLFALLGAEAQRAEQLVDPARP